MDGVEYAVSLGAEEGDANGCACAGTGRILKLFLLLDGSVACVRSAVSPSEKAGLRPIVGMAEVGFIADMELRTLYCGNGGV